MVITGCIIIRRVLNGMVRMLKQKALAGAGDVQATGTEISTNTNTEQNSIVKQLAVMLLWALLGLVMPRAGVYGGMAPFGVSFAACVSGPGAVMAYVTSAIGYLMPGVTHAPLRYIAALAAVIGIKWSLGGIKPVVRHPLFTPVITFLSVECTGLALAAVNGLNAYSAFLITAEGLLAGGASFFFDKAAGLLFDNKPQGVLSAQEQAGIVMTGAIALMASTGISVSGIVPGRIVACTVILLLARCGKEQGGSIAGTVLGLAMSMADTRFLYLAAAYAFGGFIAGIFARFGRFASAGSFITANLIVIMNSGSDTTIIIGLYEVVAACMLFLAIPGSVDRFVNRFFTSAREVPAVQGLRRSVSMRLNHASHAMNEIAKTVDAVSQRLAGISAPDLGTVYRGVSDGVCRVCGMKMHCWSTCFDKTMDVFNSLTPALRAKGQVRRADVPEEFARHCGRLDEVLHKINSGYIEYAVREGAWRRLYEIRSVVTDQFSAMSELLCELSQNFSEAERVDTEASSRIADACAEFGIPVRDAVCLVGHGGHLSVEILAEDANIKLNKNKWETAITNAVGHKLGHPSVTRSDNLVKISMMEKPRLSVASYGTQIHCTGERLCGDAYETFDNGAGRWYAVLSDGMGSGGRAAVDGAMASGLATRLIQAGFGKDSVLRMINSALMVKSGDESLATLDIVALDLYSGKVEFRKAGASPTFLCSMGRISRVEKTAMPVGILRDIRFECSEDILADGDILLMCSDGALACGVEWIENRLRDFDADSGDLKALVEETAETARQMQKEHEDDITVLAIQVRRLD